MLQTEHKAHVILTTNKCVFQKQFKGTFSKYELFILIAHSWQE